MRCFDIVGNEVPMRGAMHRIIIPKMRVKKTKAVVMPRCDYHIFAAGVLGNFHPFRGIEFLTGELVPEL